MTDVLLRAHVDELEAFTRPLHEDYAIAWLASYRSLKRRITKLFSLDIARTIAT